MRPITFLVAVLAVTPLSTVNAQDSPQVKPGDRVRVRLGVHKRVGNFVAWNGDSLAVTSDAEPDGLWFPVMSISRLEVSRGRKRNTLKGSWLGLVLGASAGGLVGALTYEAPPPEPPCVGLECLLPDIDVDPGRGRRGFIGAGIGAGIGAAIGALVGSALKTERWQEVPLDQLRVSFVPQRGGRFRIGLSVAF